jgi:large repetitive protein
MSWAPRIKLRQSTLPTVRFGTTLSFFRNLEARPRRPSRLQSTTPNVANPTATVTFTFSEAPNSFSLADATAVGGTLSDLSGSGTTYTATFTGALNTDINTASVGVIADSWQGSSGNAGAGSSTAPFTVDTVTPTVAVAVNNTNVNIANPTATVTFTFSETPSSFSLAGVTAVGGTLSNLSGSGTTYTATFTAAPNTDISTASVGVIAGSWQDSNGNAGAGGSTAPFTVDTVTPTVAVAINNTDVNVANPTATVTFTFSEAPNSFSLGDTAAVGGMLSNLTGSGTTYTATFTAAPQYQHQHGIGRRHCRQLAGEQRQCRGGRQHCAVHRRYGDADRQLDRGLSQQRR